jgi:hypothetical protein
MLAVIAQPPGSLVYRAQEDGNRRRQPMADRKKAVTRISRALSTVCFAFGKRRL